MKKIIFVLIIIIAIIAGILFWRSSSVDAPPHESALTKNNNTETKNDKSKSSDSEASFDKQKYSLNDPTSLWVVVNKSRPLNPKDYAPSDLVSVGNGQLMRAAAAKALGEMIDDAKKQGFVLTPASGYRSYDLQVTTYASEVKAYGQSVADSESARPGYSEHQTGWAMDLASGGCSVSDCFGDTPGGKWATANAYKYGFILRYPAGLENITGYRHETWHFRYVGTYLSNEMHKQGIKALEQFFDLPAAPTYTQS